MMIGNIIENQFMEVGSGILDQRLPLLWQQFH